MESSSPSSNEPLVRLNALVCPNCWRAAGVYTPFVESERDSTCFRCGFEWPRFAVTRESLPTVEEVVDKTTFVEQCRVCAGTPLEKGAIHCMDCGSWLYNGLEIK